jgi:hypothetical protein
VYHVSAVGVGVLAGVGVLVAVGVGVFVGVGVSVGVGEGVGVGGMGAGPRYSVTFQSEVHCDALTTSKKRLVE